jgi:RHS repeat-associated protein
MSLVSRNILKSFFTPSAGQASKHRAQMNDVQSNPMYRWTTHQDGLGHTWTQDIDPSTGNVLALTAPPVFTGSTSGIPQLISESWEYNPFGQVTRHKDPVERIDVYGYYTSGPQNGYLHSVTVDETGAALFTVTARDQYGNLTARTDPRGNTETFTYNQLDQVVLHVSRPEGDVSTSVDFDGANRVIGVDVKNVDENGVVEANALTSTFYYYDALGRMVKTRLEPDTVGIDTEYVYDANDHVTLERHPEAVNGHQPTNVARRLYDERDLLFRRTAAESDPQASTTQSDYDGNGNLAAVREGLESSPRVTTFAYDGYDRSRQTTAMDGTVTVSHFDANGNKVSERTDGELIVGEPGGNVRLAERSFTYDEVDRLVELDNAAFDESSQNPLYEDGFATTNVFYDPGSRVVRVEDDNGNGTNTAYDSVGRVASTTDALGNVRALAYDGNSNVVTVTETELSDLPTSPPQVFVTTHVYDSLNRLTSTTDSAGDTEQDFYDSRTNRTLHVDARGNQTRTEYDGANRPVSSGTTMTDTGDGSGSVSFVLDGTKSYDDESRLVGETDDNGNTTTHQYDALDRRVATVHDDGTAESVSYDVHGNITHVVDPNGTVTTAAFDLANRLTTRSIARAPGVLGTTSELWKYDGTGRIVYAGNDGSVVTRQYDSLSHITRESLTVGAGPTRTLTSTYDAAGRRISMTYPSGITVATDHDALDRAKTITASGPNVCNGGPTPGILCTDDLACGAGAHCQPLAPAPVTYDYAGPDRVIRRQCCKAAPNAELDVEYDAARRVSRTTHRKMIPAAVPDDRLYTWDPTGNKTSRTQMGSSGTGETATFTYDSASRMLHSATVLPGLPPASIDYTLDGVGNRVLVAGGTDGGAYSMSAAIPEPADRQVNQYTTTPFDGPREYDRNGNTLRRNGQITHADFDFRDRLVQVPTSGGTRTYAYDAMGRGIAVDCRRMFWDGDEKIEERDCSGNLVKAFVYGASGRDVVIAVGDVDGDGRLDRSAYQTDDLGNVTAVTNGNGDVLESYRYDDYGTPHVFNPEGSPMAQSAIGNDINFGGQPYDAETGLYDFRTRFYDPRAGRFISRDSIGAWGDEGNFGNGNAYVNNNPQSLTDPSGMSEQPRDYLYSKFLDGKIPTEQDFETGDKPTQPQFAALIDSMVNKITDRYLLGLKAYDETKSYSAGDKPTQAQFGSKLFKSAPTSATLVV